MAQQGNLTKNMQPGQSDCLFWVKLTFGITVYGGSIVKSARDRDFGGLEVKKDCIRK